jgi:ketopantoate reductase
MNPCYLTETKLKHLYRRFSHPLVERLYRILDRAGYNVDKKTFDYLTKYYNSYQKFGRSLKRFRFTLRDDLEFNYYIIIDIIYISGNPVLYIIDESIRF